MFSVVRNRGDGDDDRHGLCNTTLITISSTDKMSASTAPANRFAGLATSVLHHDLLFEHILLRREEKPLLGVALDKEALKPRHLAIFLLEEEIKWRRRTAAAASKPASWHGSMLRLITQGERKVAKIQALTSIIMSTYDDAVRFANDFVDLHNSLAQARASYIDVKKKTEANNFYTVHWDTFETGPIDANKVLTELEANIKDKEAALMIAKEGLEAALARMHVGEHISWWARYERWHSSVEPLVEYKPVIEEPVAQEPATEEPTTEEAATGEHIAEETAMETAMETVNMEETVCEVDDI
ncbi:hypothetical protein OPT61_g391 [Boeremia exigua]|uniref:Uncharacterized protein n=1 Tax=Boeremia exigua TaxID=749465 RepID=A0ACC2IUD2_9PLEO|nr:hypothetical protein OPT61_g391 [Boeremia exigua]